MRKKSYIIPNIICEEVELECFFLGASNDPKHNMDGKDEETDGADARKRTMSNGVYGSGKSGWGSLW